MFYLRIPTKQFRKDVKRLGKTGCDLTKLQRVIDLLITGEPLPPEYYDHVLKGMLQQSRACHIEPDWLLQYAKDDDGLILLLIRTGDHRRVLNVE